MYSERKSEVPYSSFIEMVEKGQVARVTVSNFRISFEDKKEKSYITNSPRSLTPPYLDLLVEKDITVDFKPADEIPKWLEIVFQVLPWLLILGVFFVVMNKMQGGSPRGMSFGRSRAKMFSEGKERITFKDVAGCDEAKEELAEIIDFLKHPKKFKKTGARVPRGVLMMGPPGTGKTLMARAVAGEANVPFFHMSGSDFVEMFVGVGASRVRDLFEQGKKAAPCLIFIDEIDAVGRQRGQGVSGGNDEREQTLNQLLVEMDGFDNDTGIMVIAATNRADILDQALLRPGRFDRQVTIDLPDISGREAILSVHLNKVPSAEDVNAAMLARATPGFSGADLANMINEAALIAARENCEQVFMHHFEEARDKVMMGPARKSKVMSEKEIRNTAYHEAGHALVGMLVPNGPDIHKATIIPRGRALGFVAQLPREESKIKEELIDEICMTLGGRSAEIVAFNTYTPGAMGDIQQATWLARAMVKRWGMSDKLGMVCFTENDSGFFGVKSYSDETARLIDEEIQHIITTQFERAKQIIRDNREAFVRIAETLITHETLNAEELRLLIDGKEIGPPKTLRSLRTKEQVEAEYARRVAEDANKAPASESGDGDAGGDEPAEPALVSPKESA